MQEEKIYHLKKNAWHAKLMKYMWNLRHDDFSHICPYFWLSVLNVVAIIPYFIVRILLTVIGNVFMNFLKRLDTITENWVDYNYMKIISSDAEIEKYARMIACNNKLKHRGKWQDLWDRFYYTAPDDVMSKFTKYRTKYEDSLFTEKNSKIERKRRINKIVKIVKPISIGILWIVGTAVSLFVLYWLYRFILWIPKGLAKINWVHVFFWFIGAILTSGAFLGIFALAEKGYLVMGCKTRRFFVSTGRVMILPFVKLWELITLIGQMIKESCPAIQWEEK